MDYDSTLGAAMQRAGTEDEIEQLKKRVAALEKEMQNSQWKIDELIAHVGHLLDERNERRA